MEKQSIKKALFMLFCLAFFGSSQSWKGGVFASDSDTVIVAGAQDGLEVITYSQSGGGVYGIESDLHSTGHALEIMAGRFYADTLGAGDAAKYGIFGHAHGAHAQTGVLYGGFGLAETEGNAGPPWMFGLYGRSAGCGIGKKFGVFGTVTKNRGVDSDSMFGVYGTTEPGSGSGSSRGVFGVYGKGWGSMNDTAVGVFGLGKGGIVNYGGWFEPGILIKNGGETVKLGPEYLKEGVRMTRGGNRTADTLMISGVTPDWIVQLTWRGPAPAKTPLQGICQNGILIVYFAKADSTRARTGGYYYQLTNH
jgi:hypothetical protein